MTVTAATFREHFPEFSDETPYPDAQISYWITVAGLLLNVQRWSTILDLGTELFVAHQMVLERQAQRAATAGGMPGTQIGIVSSKSVDKVSVSYEVNGAGLDPSAGHWNLTTYGMRFIQLSRMMGAGPIHVGVGCSLSELSSANAWPGPWQGNFPNMSG